MISDHTVSKELSEELYKRGLRKESEQVMNKDTETILKALGQAASILKMNSHPLMGCDGELSIFISNKADELMDFWRKKKIELKESEQGYEK